MTPPPQAAAAVTEAGAKVASAAAGVAAVALVEAMAAMRMEVTMEATAFHGEASPPAARSHSITIASWYAANQNQSLL